MGVVLEYLRARRAFSDVVDLFGERLAPGSWRAFGRQLFVHENQELPDHLVASRVEGDPSRRLYRWLPRVTVRSGGAGANSVTAIGLSGTEDEPHTLLFDWVEGVVHRVGVKRLADPDFVDHLESLDRHLPLASFRTDSDTMSMQMVDGVSLGMLPSTDRDHVIIQLLRRLADLARHSRRMGGAGVADEPPQNEGAAAYFSRLEARRLEEVPQFHCGVEDLCEVFGWDLHMPSHGDLHEKNVLVREGEPFVIDFAGCRPDVFWVDALRLIRRTAQRSYVEGRFDEALNGLWRAAGAGDLDADYYRNTIRAGQRLWALREVDDPVGVATRSPKWIRV